MNTDIRLSVEFWQHPKTYRLEKRIGLKGVRSLQILWCWCAKNRSDGNLDGLEVDEIEFVADWRGKKGAFVEACIGSWIDQTDSGYQLHEWAEYNPYQAQAGSREEARKEKARKAANARWQKSSSDNANACSDNATSNAQAMLKHNSSNATSNAKTMLKQCSDNATSNAQAMPTVPVPVPEEIKESSLRSDSFCAELSCDTSSQQQKKPVDIPSLPLQAEAAITLPLNTGQEHAVTQAEVETWQELYPAVNVPQQLRNMRGWLIGNPKKRKTKSGINRFIQNWLANEQNKGGNPRASPAPQSGNQGRSAGDAAAMKTWENYQNLRGKGIVS